jgi:hypothetical protein
VLDSPSNWSGKTGKTVLATPPYPVTLLLLARLSKNPHVAGEQSSSETKTYQVMTKTQPNVDALAIPAHFDSTGKAKGNGQALPDLAARADGYPA